ncbi:hypothetical protein PLESTB_000792300 [Pleodorina starrii]|uniref:PPM-type phosphatase domain-containing protein n=1 Tax=Pleodorina starrii TaxID=330485 RepID=A0A9W6F2H2_9CHLO|nr:hypothetical protein PLESTM_001005600 [Pleodorina starrii]GLC40150.1 hypothetical protein PLESTM_001005700 [Pleodorina starrii]GLC53834.1 hypothetical protein PLESTB_000792300 [Pleodorina starrii]GLC73014.1 hypothetical protein PLESTF_001319900 [Pleodorina starrii]
MSMSQQLMGNSLQEQSVQPLASAFVVPHPTRPNEDTFCICPLWLGGVGLVSFFGVYDGHSGSEISQFLAASLHHYVHAFGLKARDTATALCQAFQAADTALEEATLNCPDAGSTATVALLSSASVIVAHCGDSRALLCRSGRVVALTDDHRPARLDERERVLGSGGQILWNEGERVMGVLATTRAFGDRDLKQFGVTAEPEVTIIPRSADDELLILATDGVFNVLSNEEVADVACRVMKRAIERGSSRSTAIRLAASAIGRFSRDRNSKDDITVVVVDLAPPGGPIPAATPQAAAAAAEALGHTMAAAAQHQQLYDEHQAARPPPQQHQHQHQQQKTQHQPGLGGAYGCCPQHSSFGSSSPSPSSSFNSPTPTSSSSSPSPPSSSPSPSSSASFLLPLPLSAGDQTFEPQRCNGGDAGERSQQGDSQHPLPSAAQAQQLQQQEQIAATVRGQSEAEAEVEVEAETSCRFGGGGQSSTAVPPWGPAGQHAGSNAGADAAAAPSGAGPQACAG